MRIHGGFIIRDKLALLSHSGMIQISPYSMRNARCQFDY
jgi:hypothetical protein